jgi:hypothetical protein
MIADQQYPEAVVRADGQAVQEIECILDQRLRNKKVQYLVKFVGFPWQESEWTDYSPEDPAWEEDMGVVVAFQEKHPLAALYPNGQPPRGSASPNIPAPVLRGPSTRQRRVYLDGKLLVKVRGREENRLQLFSFV